MSGSGVDPGGGQPAKANSKDAQEEPADVGEEGSSKGEAAAAAEPKEEASVPRESGSDRSQVSPPVARGVAAPADLVPTSSLRRCRSWGRELGASSAGPAVGCQQRPDPFLVTDLPRPSRQPGPE